MLILKGHYSDKGLREEMAAQLSMLDTLAGKPIFLGIGSERHILDCLGPLTGSMIQEKAASLLVYGTLDEPLHAKNLASRMELIRRQHPGCVEIAIDASLATADDLGMVKLFQGTLQPGKAVARKLEPVGHFYITGIVAGQDDKPRLGRSSFGSISHVYQMARLISDAVGIWHNSRI
jgi:putative sporulation protein YyaC